MSPEVTAAIIAASVGVITVIATVAVQISGRRATSRDTQHAFDEQREQLDRTLAEQRTRTLNERFAAAAGQLGDDKPPAVRLAGVYAMVGLADDWPENMQTCVDVLCAYLRMPYGPDPGDEAAGPERLAFRASREVRHTVIRVIAAHLRDGAVVSWQGLNFDFTGVIFDGGDFTGARFSGGTVRFARAEFSGGQVSFVGSRFSGGTVRFDLAVFSGGTVRFGGAVFSGGTVDFGGAEFSGGTVSFDLARFSGGTVNFDYGGAVISGGTVRFDRRGALFSGGTVSLNLARFSGGTVRFDRAVFSGGTVDFGGAVFSGGTVSFDLAEFSGGTVRFGGAVFSGGTVRFGGRWLPLRGERSTRFSGGTVNFDRAVFSGGTVGFRGLEFTGGEVDFSSPSDWSVPPTFPWTDTPPPGVKLPRKEDQSQT